MAYSIDKKTGRITIRGFDKGIAPSPHEGIGDLKNVNISTIKGEASVNFSRVRQDQASVTNATASTSTITTSFAYAGTTLANGTWIIIDSHTGSPGTTDGHYYWVFNPSPGTINLYTGFSSGGGTNIITSGGVSTITFHTLTMGIPVAHCIENHSASSADNFRYYILDTNGIIWISGTSTVPGGAGKLTTTTTWTAITPNAASNGAISNNGAGTSINVQYATDANNKFSASYLIIFSQTQILYCKTSDDSGWPSNGGTITTIATQPTLNYSGGYSHFSLLGLDQVLYFCDGPGIGVIYQKAGQVFNPGSAGTFSIVNAQYIMAPEDAATTLNQLPTGNSIAILVGGLQNNIYVYPDVQSSSSSKPLNILWMPESNTVSMVSANNYVFIFCGSKGNIYLTDGSHIIPVASVPDYVAGSASYVQEPYFTWGDAMFLRGRVWFSIKDQTNTHTGNCGGIWSFIPTFNYFPQQDTGLALRLEAKSAVGNNYNGYATVLFAGNETTAQQGNGAQYVAGWNQSTPSIDFSGTNPYTDGSALIETDAIPVGDYMNKATFQQIGVKFATPLVAGESVAINYRTDLTSSWTSAGTVSSESPATGEGSTVDQIIEGITIEKVELLQLQILLTSTTSSPSYCRLQEIYVNP